MSLDVTISIYETFAGIHAEPQWSESNPVNLTDFSISGDKLVDDEFFMFEGSTCNLTFVSTTAETLRNLLFDASVMSAVFPEYRNEQGHKQPDVLTEFLDKKVVVRSGGLDIFIGSPLGNSISFNYKTGELSFTVAGIDYIIIDNIERIDSRILIDTLIDKVGGGSWQLFNSSEILCEALLLSKNVGISVKSIIPDENVSVGPITSVVIPGNSPMLFYNEVEPMGVYLENDDLNFEHWTFSKKVGIGRRNNNRFIDIRWYEILERLVTLVKEYQPDHSTGQTQDPDIMENVTLRFWAERKISIDTSSMAVTVEAIKYKNNIPTGGKYNDENATIRYTAYAGIDWVLILMNRKPSIVPIVQSPASFTETFTNGGVVIHKEERKVLVYGTFAQPTYKLSLKNGKFTSENTDGIFDASSNTLSDIIKYTLLGTGKYLKIRQTQIDADIDIVNISGNSIIIPMGFVTEFKGESFVFNIISEFDSINFSNTDRHFILRAFAMIYKNITKQFLRKFNITVVGSLLPTGISVGDIISVNGIELFVNEIDWRKELLSIKCIKKA